MFLPDEEKKILRDWFARSGCNQELFEEMIDSSGFTEELKQLLSYDSKALWLKIRTKIAEIKASGHEC